MNKHTHKHREREGVPIRCTAPISSIIRESVSIQLQRRDTAGHSLDSPHVPRFDFGTLLLLLTFAQNEGNEMWELIGPAFQPLTRHWTISPGVWTSPRSSEPGSVSLSVLVVLHLLLHYCSPSFVSTSRLQNMFFSSLHLLHRWPSFCSSSPSLLLYLFNTFMHYLFVRSEIPCEVPTFSGTQREMCRI